MAQPIIMNLQNNRVERTPCALVLDMSGSMGEVATDGGDGRAIDALNAGLQTFDGELKADNEARRRVQVLVVGVGGEARVLQEWIDASEFTPPTLTAGGATPLGQGVRVALERIEAQKVQYRANGIAYKRPWLIIMSDGAPTDDWQTVAQQCRQAEADKKVTVFSVGVGGAVLDTLAQFSTRGAQPLDRTRFGEFFVWLSASTVTVSKSAEGQQVALPPISDWATVTA